MRKGFWKRKMSALLLCAALAAQPSFAAGTRVRAEEGQAVTQAEESGAAADSVSGGDGSLAAESARAAAGDVTPPVIESFIFRENGQSVEKNGELHFTLKAYDLESGIESVEITLVSGKYMDSDGKESVSGIPITYSAFMTYDEAEDSYGLTVNTANLSSRYPAFSWEFCYVQKVTVLDKNGNQTRLQVGKNGETYLQDYTVKYYLYGCSVDVPARGSYVSISEITVGDGRESYTAGDEIAVSVAAAVINEERDRIDRISIYFSEHGGKSIYLSRDDEGVYRGNWTIEENTYPGEYVLSWIDVYGSFGLDSRERLEMEDSNIAVTIEQPGFDLERPVIQEISLGESQGKLLKAGDQVDITVRATDNRQLKETATVFFQMILDNVKSEQKSVTLTYDEAAGAYRGSLTVTEDMYPSEWYMIGASVRDSMGNSAFDADAGIGSATHTGAPSHYPYYFRVEQEGVYVEPTVNVEITWNRISEDGYSQSVYSKVIENACRRTTIGALLEGEEIPTEPFHGMECLGWYTADGRPLDKAEEIVINNRTFALYMAYDKIPVGVRFKYLDEKGAWKQDTVVCLGQEGDSVDALASACLKEKDIPRVIPSGDGEVRFLEWTPDYDYTRDTLDRGYGRDNRSYTASYEGIDEGDSSAEITMYRMDGQGQLVEETVCKHVPAGTTYAEILETLPAPEVPAGETFTKWQFYSTYNVGSQKTSERQNSSVKVFACYEGRTLVASDLYWFGEEGKTQSLDCIGGVWMDTAEAEALTLEQAKGLFVKELTDIVLYPGLRFSNWYVGKNNSASIPEGWRSYTVSAQYENGGVYLQYTSSKMPGMKSEVLKIGEVGEKVTLPTVRGNYKNLIWRINGNSDTSPIVTEVTISQGMKYVYCTGYGEEPAASPDPSESPEPGASPEPSESPDPGATAEPGESPAPGVSPEPSESPAPGASAEPSASPEPGATTEPGTSPAPGTTPEPGATSKPGQSSSSGELDRETIEKTTEEIKKAADGAVLKVPMGDATVASEEILKAAKGKDVELVLDMGGYSWTINGRDIKASNPKSIDLKVLLDVDTVPSDVVSAVVGHNYARQVELVHNGDFGFMASLTLNLGAEHSGQNASLYYYDSSNKLIFNQGRTIDGDGNVTMSFSHASNYVIVIETGEDVSSDESGGEDDTEPDEGQAGNENARPLSPNTGEPSGSEAVAVIAVCLLLAAAAAVFLKRKRF